MSKQLLGLPAKILAIKVSQQIEIMSLRKYTLQRVVYCNTVLMIKQKPCVKKLAITKMQKMISTQLPVPLILFSMRVKRDIQAKHTHKVKLCVLKSPRTHLHSPHIPLDSLLTVQRALKGECRLDRTTPKWKNLFLVQRTLLLGHFK